MHPRKPLIHLPCIVLFQGSQAPRHTCHTSLCICYLSCAQKDSCHTSLCILSVSVLFRGTHAPTETCHTSLRIRSLSGCAHEARRLVIGLYVFHQVIRLGRSVPTVQRNYCRRGTPKRCGRTPICHSLPVPAPLSKLTRACPPYGSAFTR